MQKRSWLVGLSLLIVVTTMLLGLFPGASHAQQATEGNFVFVNYIGQDLTLDLDDMTYTVPGTETVPGGGRLTLTLAPGEHKFAASVPSAPIGDSGTFVIQSGEVVGRAARLDKTDAAISREGIVLRAPRDRVTIFEFNPLAPATTPTPVTDTWQPQPAPAGMGSLVWINYNGDELTVDLAGTLYKVPPQAQGIPGRLQVSVQPGNYSFTVSVPYGSLNGQVNVTAGQVVGMNVSAKPQPAPTYEVGEESPLPQPVDLLLNQEDLTARATINQAPATPAPAGTTQAAPAPAGTAQATPAATQPGVLVKNFTGDTLVFTINGQQYFIPAQSEQTIQLPAGQYNYTASLPFVARTGTVNLGPAQSVTLSVATNVEGNTLNVYSQ